MWESETDLELELERKSKLQSKSELKWRMGIRFIIRKGNRVRILLIRITTPNQILNAKQNYIKYRIIKISNIYKVNRKFNESKSIRIWIWRLFSKETDLESGMRIDAKSESEWETLSSERKSKSQSEIEFGSEN